MGGRRGKAQLGVDWHMPDGRGGYAKRAYASTTRATSDLVEVLATDGHTVQSAHDAILFDPDAKAVLAAMVDRGLGPDRLDRYVRGGRQ